jgi:hypothetical protein
MAWLSAEALRSNCDARLDIVSRWHHLNGCWD